MNLELLHKLLADAGVRLGVAVSDIHGQAGRAMIKALIASKPVSEILDLAGRLRASREELFEAILPEDLSHAHLFVLSETMAHIEALEASMARFDHELQRAGRLAQHSGIASNRAYPVVSQRFRAGAFLD